MEDDKMKRAYGYSSKAFREKLHKESEPDARILEQIEATDIIVVTGEYDKAELVLSSLSVKFTVIVPHHVKRVNLRPEQTVLINCPGNLDRPGIENIRQFVEAGGLLVTTDWALKHVLEPAFPGYVRYNEKPTGDDVVRIQFHDEGHKFLDGLIEKSSDPLWWLEGSSYPIEVLDKEKVTVLISSGEMGEKYGESPIAIKFSHGKGEVFHIVSHYYLQRSELRSAKDKDSAKNYFSDMDCLLNDEVDDDLFQSDVASAYTSTSFLSKMIIEKKKKMGFKTGDEKKN
ncbi:MAG TPA: hypothetical protein PLK94_00080 [Alphaproteobacteria bacterium]|nr:hypothetical protein [Alphaproteobacteria bacterium]